MRIKFPLSLCASVARTYLGFGIWEFPPAATLQRVAQRFGPRERPRLHLERFHQDDAGWRLQAELHPVDAAIDDAPQLLLVECEVPERRDVSVGRESHGEAIIAFNGLARAARS